ncbi:MAG TPA: aspartate-semialdehyde dehydrogenase [Clostridia bacterium]|nr:aspartate-semialdehyde dehydrogenase [Clostridia bacterium]
MKGSNVAILGATGAVGRQMLRCLEERDFPVGELRLLASAKSAGAKLSFRGGEIEVLEADEEAFGGLDIVLGAVQAPLARRFAPAIAAAGAVFIDNSSAFRLLDEVPLVVPEINAQDVKTHKGIISNPNCSTIIALVAVNAINRISPIKAMYASTYQAVSGAGALGVVELEEETRAIVNGDAVKPSVFRYQIAENLIPQIGGFEGDGYTTEEMKMQREGRKITHRPELIVNCTCVRVPVMRSHSISVTVITESPVSPFEARAAVEKAPGCKLADDPVNCVYPMPLPASDQDLVFVGRIRRDPVSENGLTLWCSGDQLRKGAATNAVQIAELLVAG